MSDAIPDRILSLIAKAKPDDVRFIKLGPKSAWWPASKENNALRFGYREFDFALCKQGNWSAARESFEKNKPGLTPGVVTQHLNQVREFFELPESTLWMTIEDGDVWWCFSDSPVEDIFKTVEESDRIGSKQKRVIDRWRNTDIHGKRLRIDLMTTRVTKVTSFQGTICKPDGAVDLLRLIRGEQSAARAAASAAVSQLALTIGDLLDQLHQNDFELLVELIFSSSGWQRISPLGGIQKTLDLALTLPTTGESCFVQVKSQTTQSKFETLIEELSNHSGYSKMFFVYHTPAKAFRNPDENRVIVWSRYEVAKQVISAGLADWVIGRTT